MKSTGTSVDTKVQRKDSVHFVASRPDSTHLISGAYAHETGGYCIASSLARCALKPNNNRQSVIARLDTLSTRAGFVTIAR